MSTQEERVPAACCPLPAGVAPLPMGPEMGPDGDEDQPAGIARVAHALSDPLRVRMLQLIAGAAESRGQAAAGAAPPVGDGQHETPSAGAVPAGVCACEFQGLYGIGQSRVSYHLKVLREAGLVREQRRGKWSFYALDEAAAREFRSELGALLRL